jgi:hypothetical protein
MKMVPIAAAAVLASCALPPNVSIGNRVMLDGTRAGFQNCAVSVAFSGEPRALHPNESARYTAGLGKSTNSQWQVDGLVYEEFRASQTAICACRTAEFSTPTCGRPKSRWRAIRASGCCRWQRSLS